MELHIFAEATERMNELRKDNNEGKISANVVVEDPKCYGGIEVIVMFLHET